MYGTATSFLMDFFFDRYRAHLRCSGRDFSGVIWPGWWRCIAMSSSDSGTRPAEREMRAARRFSLEELIITRSEIRTYPEV